MWERVSSASINEIIERSYLKSIDKGSAIELCQLLSKKDYANDLYIVIGMGHLSVCFQSYEAFDSSRDVKIGISSNSEELHASIYENPKVNRFSPNRSGSLNQIIEFIDLFAMKQKLLKSH